MWLSIRIANHFFCAANTQNPGAMCVSCRTLKLSDRLEETMKRKATIRKTLRVRAQKRKPVRLQRSVRRPDRELELYEMRRYMI